MSLPKLFCWTRFGTEAGEEIAQIVERKERERTLNGGLFLWGIGNAIGPSMRQLLRLEPHPEVIFSPIRSAPRKEDVSPNAVIRWTVGMDLEGRRYDLPAGSLVTSRFKDGWRRACHYALVCTSATTLRIDANGETLEFKKLRNLVTDRPVGASQVTAVVKQTGHEFQPSGLCYRVALRVRLVFPYFVQLVESAPFIKAASISAA